MTSNFKDIVFFPGLNQAPGSFIFSNSNVKYISLSFNKKGRIDLEDDCKQILKVLKGRSQSYIVAHSLSALLIEWLIQNGKVEVEASRIIYVAPAFYPVNGFSKVIEGLGKKALSRLPIPSFAPPKTRVDHYINLEVYSDIIHFNRDVNIEKCQIQCVVDARDEMLSLKYLKRLPKLTIVSENDFPHHRCYKTLKRIVDSL